MVLSIRSNLLPSESLKSGLESLLILVVISFSSSNLSLLLRILFLTSLVITYVADYRFIQGGVREEEGRGINMRLVSSR